MEEIEDYSIVVEVKQLTELAQSEEEVESNEGSIPFSKMKTVLNKWGTEVAGIYTQHQVCAP